VESQKVDEGSTGTVNRKINLVVSMVCVKYIIYLRICV
jgi:hypothetical protein